MDSDKTIKNHKNDDEWFINSIKKVMNTKNINELNEPLF